MVEALLGLRHDPGQVALSDLGGKAVELHRLVASPAKAACVEVAKEKAVAGLGFWIEGVDGVVEAAGIVGDGEGSIFRADHLGESARLEEGRHEDEIRSGVGLVGEIFAEIGHGDAVGDPVHIDDILEVRLECSVGDDHDLQLFVGVVSDQLIEDIGEELAALLNGVEAGGPVEERGVRIHVETDLRLEGDLVLSFAFCVGLAVEVVGEVGIGFRVEDGVGGVEDPGGTSGAFLGPELVPDVAGDELVMSLDDLVKEGGADAVDVVGSEDAAGEQVGGV